MQKARFSLIKMKDIERIQDSKTAKQLNIIGWIHR